MNKYWGFIFISFIASLFIGCESDDPPNISKGNLEDIPYAPNAYTYKIPNYYPQLEYPSDNMPTAEGIELGRRLFYDPILSGDSTMGCFSCHDQKKAFTDGLALSNGIQGLPGTRSAMSLVDIGFHYGGLLWDGRAKTLELQALIPVNDPIELHGNWPDITAKLARHPDYPKRFREAFGITDTKEITKELVAKALAQFQRTIITSGKSKYDLVKENKAFFEPDELDGFDMFFDRAQPILPDAECGHCHNEPLFTTNEFFNNGIDPAKTAEEFTDIGLGIVTNNPHDYGKFKAPTLRNIMLTAPYMHDGRFKTIEEVLEHYNSGGHPSIRRDPLIRELKLTDEYKKKIIAFLHTLTDTALINNPALSNPFH